MKNTITTYTADEKWTVRAADLPETVNIFLTPVCNFRCKHCYATFNDINDKTPRFMPKDVVIDILEAISQQPLPVGVPARKITFVGGEPTLHPDLVQIVRTAKTLRLDVAVITNGTRITPAYLDQFYGDLDWIGFSIDSFWDKSNQAIGRCSAKGIALTAEQYFARIGWVKERGIALKINTVVNAYNWDQAMVPFILRAHPDRWKVLQVTPIEGQNDERIDEMQITPEQFQHFVRHHSVVREHGITMVSEAIEDIRGSYAMISPDGRFFGNDLGRHAYSAPISDVGLMEAFSQVSFDAAKFEQRGGSYRRSVGMPEPVTW